MISSSPPPQFGQRYMTISKTRLSSRAQLMHPDLACAVSISCSAAAASNELPGVARLAVQRAQLHWIDLEPQMSWCDERIACHVRCDDRAKKAAALHGIGPVTASAVVVSGGDFRQFANARQLGAVRSPIDTMPLT